MRKSALIMGSLIGVLVCIACAVWYAAFREFRSGVLTVSFLNVGEGDAIFIEAPSGRQMLIDGGPDTSVLRELGTVMPWYDRSIDVVVATHPDADHIAGLVDVFDRYDVAYFIHSSVEGTTEVSHALTRAARTKQSRDIVALRGQIIDLGDGAYVEIVLPDRNLAHADTNVACVVTRLVYGTTAFLFPCDAPQTVEKYAVSLDGHALKADVLKAGHHGSKTSSSATFVGYVDPTYVVYSRGCHNRYGFPSRETVALYKAFDIAVADTCVDGTVMFTSDGTEVARR